MMPELPYYDIEDLLERWSKYKVKEKHLLKLGANSNLQFSIELGAGTTKPKLYITQRNIKKIKKEVDTPFGMGYQEDYETKLCDEKTVSYKNKGLFDVTPATISDLLSGEKNPVVLFQPWMKNCKGCSESCDNIRVTAIYEINDRRDPSDFMYRCTTDDLVVKPDEVLRFEEKYFTANAEHSHHKNEMVQATEKMRKKNINTVSVPKGTVWEQVTISFDASPEHVTIKTRGKEYKRKFNEIGFMDNRSKRPNKNGQLLLIMAASSKYPEKSIRNFSKSISLLNKALKQILPNVDGNPFKPYVRKIGYAPRINLSIAPTFDPNKNRLS